MSPADMPLMSPRAKEVLARELRPGATIDGGLLSARLVSDARLRDWEANSLIRILIAELVLQPTGRRTTTIRDSFFRVHEDGFDPARLESHLAPDEIPTEAPAVPTPVAPLKRARLDAPLVHVLSMPPELAPIASTVPHASQQDAFGSIIDRAKVELCILAPYLDRPGLGVFLGNLLAAVRRGVTIRLVSRKDNNYRHEAYGLLRGACEAEGYADAVTVREFDQRGTSGPFRLHAKLVAADGRSCYIGSGEFRAYSLFTNIELGAIVSGQDAALYAAVFERVWEGSVAA